MASQDPHFDFREDCGRIIQHLRGIEINFIALDFDKTLIECHTGGAWKNSVDSLARYIRPFFKAFIPAAIDANIYIAIVTFSPQVDLIREMLMDEFPGHGGKIVIRGMNDSWHYTGAGCSDGKQGHMASAVEEISDKSEAKITRRSTLLVDDDHKNIQHALSNGVKAVLFIPSQPELLTEHLMTLPS